MQSHDKFEDKQDSPVNTNSFVHTNRVAVTMPSQVSNKCLSGDTMNTKLLLAVSESVHDGSDCSEYQLSSVQNMVKYGCVLLSPIKLFTGDPTHWKRIHVIIQAHLLVKHSDIPNFLGLRIPVQTRLTNGGHT